ncbi:hypothetical protein NP233_g1374 [Leucocoprinus birnbaumii]|uniref:Peptide transporter PTR2A n=1 Tax=Leucocoprinus birnbaumii TaxID=56174 RepID=A0AAD5W473_9AGAR|nr:hypothetical protein NP233_g1374 [Leucocoprinus birnbaumii]
MATFHTDDAAVVAVVHSDKLDEKASQSHESYAPDIVDAPADAHEGLTFPTEEERITLRRVADSLPWNAYLIAFVELAERFSFYGSQVVFTNFIQQGLPPGSHTGAGGPHGQSGALGLGQQSATGLNTFYQFWCYVTPLFGAWIADTYWGRFNTVCVAVAVALVGHVILVVSAVPGVIEQKSALGAFIVGMIITGLGTGLFKANISPLIAEQYKRDKMFVLTTKSGERVLVDPSLTVSRMYMYFYLFINIGAVIGQISMTYAEKYVGFWLAYTLPTAVFLLCPFILFYGRNRYVRTPPAGSVFSTTLRLWKYAARGRWSFNPMKTMRNLRSDDFWENAKPSRISPEDRPKWMNFDDQWVEEVRRGFKACAVFVWFPIYWLTYNQINSNLLSQAATMETHGLPNDILSNLDPIALIIFIPIVDILIYPALRRMKINFSALKKMTGGFLTSSMGMVWAAVVQHYIYKTNPCHYSAATCKDADGNALVSPLNVWIQSGSYVLIAFGEIFASITGLEYAFTKAPKNMRSLVMAVFLFTSAIASAIGEAFVPLSTDPLLVWNYGVMGVLAGVAGVLFWLSVRKLDREEDRLNNLDEGHVEGGKA